MRVFLILLLAVAVGGLTRAQTNLLKSASPKPPATQKTEIRSDSAVFDNNTRRLVYTGNVVVTDPKVIMRCDQLTVDLPPEGQNRPTNILAEAKTPTGVTIDFTDEKGMTNHLTSSRAVYVYSVVNMVTNWTITFTGTPTNPATGTPAYPPHVETEKYTVISEPLIRDLATDRYIFTNHIITIKQGLQNATNGGSPFNFMK